MPSDTKPDHVFNGDDLGHNCVTCIAQDGDDSIWKCDAAAHMQPFKAGLSPELREALDAHAKSREVHPNAV